MGLVLGELVAQQSSGRYLALPTLGVEATVATHSLVFFAAEVQGVYVPDTFQTGATGDGTGSVATAVSVGTRLRNHQAVGEAQVGPGLRVHSARFGEFGATEVRPAVRARLAVGWQFTPTFLLRGGVGTWVGPDAVDVDATVGASVCF